MGKYSIIPSESQQDNRLSEGTVESIFKEISEGVPRTAPRNSEGGGSRHSFDNLDEVTIAAGSESSSPSSSSSSSSSSSLSSVKKTGGTNNNNNNKLVSLCVCSFLVLVGLRAAIAVPMHPSLGNPKMRHHVPYVFDEDPTIEDYEDDEARSNGLDDTRRHHVDPLDSGELEKIRRSIMEGLGLSRIPDPSKANVSQTEYENAHREYLKRLESSGEHEERTRRRLHVFHPAEYHGNGSGINLGDAGDPRSLYYFPVDIPDQEQALSHATLRILLGGNPNTLEAVEQEEEEEEEVGREKANEDDHAEVVLYQPTRLSRRLLARQRLDASWPTTGPRWIEFDSTEAVESWLYEREENLGLEVEILRRGRVETEESIIRYPALNVFTVAQLGRGPSRRRNRRATPDELMSPHKGRRTECRGQNKKCCRHQMTVTFKDLAGFEFIIQPKTFDAGYCKGRCPPRYNPAHHHAVLQSLIWKENRKKVPRPCCAPSKLAEIEILYFDENDSTKLKILNWKNMRVLECACS